MANNNNNNKNYKDNQENSNYYIEKRKIKRKHWYEEFRS